jgi:hypothetical protein
LFYNLCSFGRQNGNSGLIDSGSRILPHLRFSISLGFVFLVLANQCFAQDSTTKFGSATLQPGDIINFIGGDASLIGHGQKYGHTALYLGRHSDTNVPYFFDFQTADYGALKLPSQNVFEDAYYKRDPKRQVDIFRPKFTVDVEKLQIAAARLVGDPDHHYFASVHHSNLLVCSQGAFDLLKAASTDSKLRDYDSALLGEVAPNSYNSGGNVGAFFQKVNGEAITVGDAYNDDADSTDSDSSYLTKVAKDSDKLVALEKSYWATQDEIRNPDNTADLASIEKSKETGWRYFKAMVRYACADPNGLDEAARSHDAYGIVFSYSVLAHSYYRDQPSLSACVRGIIEPMLAARTPLSYSWLVKQARAYRKQVEKRAKKEAEARQREIEREEAAEASREYSHSAAAVNGSTNTSSRIHNSEGLAYTQLVGIAGGQLSFDGR